MLLPVGAKNFSEALQIGSEVYHTLKEILKKEFGKASINVGDEGGFAPPMSCYEEPFDYIMDAVEELGYFKKIKLGIVMTVAHSAVAMAPAKPKFRAAYTTGTKKRLRNIGTSLSRTCWA